MWEQAANTRLDYSAVSVVMGVDAHGDILSTQSSGSCPIKLPGSDGANLWTGRPCLDGWVSAIGLDAGGMVAAAGSVVKADRNADFAVRALSDFDGAELWRRVFPSQLGGRARAVAIDQHGDVVAAGLTQALSRLRKNDGSRRIPSLPNRFESS
jgi:hypothetical protein